MIFNVFRSIKFVGLLVVACMMLSCANEESRRKHVSKKELIAYNQKLVKMDSAAIVHYCYKNKLDSLPNRQGLWLTVNTKGSGTQIVNNQTVTLSYSISDLLGNIYYTSQRDGNKIVKVGSGNDIMGLDMALPQLQQGAKATLIVMPDLAFGLIGDENKIQGRKILRYDIEVLNVE